MLLAAIAAAGLQAADETGNVAPAATGTPAATATAAVEPADAASAAGDSAKATVAAHGSAEAETVAVPGFSDSGETQERISISLDDVPLQDVVRMFTRISGANIIATATNLGGRVTVNLQDVEWKPALGSILDMYNMQISEKIPGSGIYSVMPKAPGGEEPLVASTIFLNYASVSNVAQLVRPLIVRNGTVTAFPQCNALVVKATAANVNEIRKVITDIDLPRKQVYIEAKFLELNDEAIKDLGINWQVLEGYGVGVGGLQWGIQETRDKLDSRSDTYDRQDSRVRADALNERYDANGNLYSEDTTVIEELPVGSGNYVSRTVATPARSVNDTISQSASAQSTQKKTFDKATSDIRTAVLSASDFQVVLSALKQLNGVSVVSNPKIIVANEQTATIHIGENEPNVKGTVTAGQQGQANTTTYALDEAKPYFEFGIKLDVTPTINNASNITVAINPTLSRYVRDKVTPDNNSFPVETTKKISTTFALQDGKTAAIGGLTETSDRKEEKKIPLLGDIPLIGKYLFTHTHDQHVQTETIIFVTVGLASPVSIDRETGLPEDTELVQRHLAAKKAKAQRAASTSAPSAGTNAVTTNAVAAGATARAVNPQ